LSRPGYITVPEGPGFGFAVKEDLLDKLTVDRKVFLKETIRN
jgi:L-alanine-DL-glutamate epimerase-like enolase superfamily enzyme